MYKNNYLIFPGNCISAIELYSEAFNRLPKIYTKYGDIETHNFDVPLEYKDKISNATFEFGDISVKLSDSSPNISETSNLGSFVINIELDENIVKNAFEVLSREGTVLKKITKTFFTPCTCSVYDKFGILWNMSATKK